MKFIVIDGLDGSGKDTQVNLLEDMYRSQGKNVVIRSHPSPDNYFGLKSKEALLKTGKLNHLKATLFFAGDAIRSVIKYYYGSDDIDVLIFSRYIMSVVYLPNVINIIVYKIVSIVLPTSNYMFFLDVSPEESLRRIAIRSEDTEMFENYDSLEKAREKSKKVADDWHVIPGDGDAMDIGNKIKSICLEDS
ncbi:MAG: thymidylate kinase [Methanobrevibacter sp.]|uniref:thymidylate kinase n=1 Tax=Methanobrevibacter sp. TaxID=66852 RepID=UPI0026E0A290|nr:thymidylate kinase [Methanobrevibacter sp.]MDO5849243.1 thymidylate kinase [Methanobrevibacter sp.]